MKRLSFFEFTKQIDQAPEEERPILGSMVDFVKRTDPDWIITKYHSIIAEKIDYYVALSKKTKERYYIFFSAPPRHGKSVWTVGKYSAYHLCKYPKDNILIWTHSVDLAVDFSHITRSLLEEHDLSAKVMTGSKKSRRAIKEWKTTENGGVKISGLMTRSNTGKGFNLIFIDDVYPNETEYLSKAYNKRLKSAWGTAISNRLAPGGVFIIPMVNWGLDDLGSHIRKTLRENGLESRVIDLRFPAFCTNEKTDLIGRKLGEPLFPELWPAKALLEIKAVTPPHIWEAVFQCNPQKNIHGFYNSQKFFRAKQENGFITWVDDKKTRYTFAKENVRFFQFWDTAIKASETSAFTVCATVGFATYKTRHFVIIYEIFRQKLNTSELYPALKDQYRKHPYVKKIFIEEAASGYGLIELAQADRYPANPIKTKGKSKEERAIALQSLYLQNAVCHLAENEGEISLWIPDFEKELIEFPGDTLDQADAANYAGVTLLHDLAILRGDKSGTLYGIIESIGTSTLNSESSSIGTKWTKSINERVYALDPNENNEDIWASSQGRTPF